MEHAYITGDVLVWARKRSGFTKEKLAAELAISREILTNWEDGREFPAFGKAQTLASILRIPFGYLFLSNPPTEAPPIPDLRTVDGERRPPSPEFIELLNDVLYKHDWYSEYIKLHGAKPLAFVGRFSGSSPFAEVVSNVRQLLKPEELRNEAPNWSEYLRLLVERAEQLNIVVMRGGVVRNSTRGLSVREFRGFAISDRYAPLIFINSKDAQAAQIFTFAHELFHLWIGQSGISNPEPTSVRQTSQVASIEQFCNKAAAELLVPAAEFDLLWQRSSGDPKSKTNLLARKFKVSVPVILRRASERNAISSNTFIRLFREHEEEVQALEERKQEETSEKSSGGNFYNTFFARHSRLFSRAVTSAVRSGQLGALEAAQMLSVRTSTISKLAERISS